MGWYKPVVYFVSSKQAYLEIYSILIHKRDLSSLIKNGQMNYTEAYSALNEMLSGPNSSPGDETSTTRDEVDPGI